uniref:tetratricopeptide repeat protein 31-like isoform X1 n=2 Tax=Monopterus albus TaxID=43700 RepID=UPI0009B3C7BB|nr:tetratricopeptide repeat protein 31-like isoform X1 [Monopterus albus]
MPLYKQDTEYTDIRMFRVMDVFDGGPPFQRIVRVGLLDQEYNDDLDDYAIDSHVHGHNHFHGYPRLSDMSRDIQLRGQHTRSSSFVCHPTLHYYTSPCDLPRPPSVKVQAKESDSEIRYRVSKETEKSRAKADKKRLKKKKQKEKKQREKLGKEKQNPNKNEDGKEDAQQSKAHDGKPVNDESNGDADSSGKQLGSAKDTDSSSSSEDETSDEDDDTKSDSCDFEELDMTSTFVSKVKLKLEQKPKPERREKKKVLVKEEHKTSPNKPPNEDQEAEKKDSATSRTNTLEDNVKISTELANVGNGFASSGDYNMAVKYFTDAIKYNPTEFKLFGNRSFCFEKMQEYEKALTDADLCLRLCPGWVKGLFRKGRALAGLKRYKEAAQAFSEVLKLDSSCVEAAQELMRVQITQLMGYGFTREQSSNALIIHETVEKALEVLTKLNHQPGTTQHANLLPVQVANVTGVSPVLSASTSSTPAAAANAPQSQTAPKIPPSKPLGSVQHMSAVQSQPKPILNQAMKSGIEANRLPLRELFPVWVGNLVHPVTESMITNLFNKVGVVYSVKVLINKRCAFVNFTKQEYCDEAIRRFNGFEFNGFKIVVRYPDRIPHGMGISKSALKADDLQDENMRQSKYGDERNAGGSRRPVRPCGYVLDYRGNHQY